MHVNVPEEAKKAVNAAKSPHRVSFKGVGETREKPRVVEKKPSTSTLIDNTLKEEIFKLEKEKLKEKMLAKISEKERNRARKSAGERKMSAV